MPLGSVYRGIVAAALTETFDSFIDVEGIVSKLIRGPNRAIRSAHDLCSRCSMRRQVLSQIKQIFFDLENMMIDDDLISNFITVKINEPPMCPCNGDPVAQSQTTYLPSIRSKQ